MAKPKRKFLSSTRLAPLEFRVFKQFEASGFRADNSHPHIGNTSEKTWLVACSGGRDSIVLSHILSRVAPRLGATITLAHVHHGANADRSISEARNRALARVGRVARELGVPALSIRYRGKQELQSEAELRDFRLRALEKIRQSGNFGFVAFAHHRDDLFETRMIRLLRGTGAQGLKAMQFQRARALRPLLGESREAICAYASEKSLEWIEDPTNAENGPLRNWLRNEWLPSLERKRPGSTQSLIRSLENLAESVEFSGSFGPSFGPNEVDDRERKQNRSGLVLERDIYNRSSRETKRQMIASFLLARGLRDFTSAHVEEIRKRLDSPRQSFQFRILKFIWVINAGCVRVDDCEADPIESDESSAT